MSGDARAKALQFVASELWQPYLDVIKQQAGHALHTLDRFHVVAKLNKAVDEVSAKEAHALVRRRYEPILKHTRWRVLKRMEK